MIQSFELHKSTEKDSWDSVLAATIFAVRTIVHIVLQMMPIQIVFWWDTILNLPFEADWS